MLTMCFKVGFKNTDGYDLNYFGHPRRLLWEGSLKSMTMPWNPPQATHTLGTTDHAWLLIGGIARYD